MFFSRKSMHAGYTCLTSTITSYRRRAQSWSNCANQCVYFSRALISIVRDGPWPFPLVVQVTQNSTVSTCTYTPRSDFLVTKNSLPRLLIEVNSMSPDKDPEDFFCMLVQGACIVRFANLFIDAYSANKNFILVAIFIRHDGHVDRCLLFQSHTPLPTPTNEVCVHALIIKPIKPIC